MKSEISRAIIFTPVLFFVFSAFMLSQKPPVSQPDTTPERVNRDLISEEQALEQSRRSIAAIYREMAVPRESDSAQVREQKHQYERLAENEEKAALAAKKLVAYHARLAALLSQAAPAAQHRNVTEDSAYRK
jgi:hypothetical protein